MDIEEKLVSTAFEEIKAENLQITSGCRDYLAAFIKQGASNLQNKDFLAMSGMDNEFPPTEAEETFAMKFAEDNLLRFVNRMIGYALAHNEMILNEDSFCSIRDKICPLFPFC